MTWHTKWGGALALWEGGHLVVSRQKIGVELPYEWSIWGKTDGFAFDILVKGYSSSLAEGKMEAEVALSNMRKGS